MFVCACVFGFVCSIVASLGSLILVSGDFMFHRLYTSHSSSLGRLDVDVIEVRTGFAHKLVYTLVSRRPSIHQPACLHEHSYNLWRRGHNNDFHGLASLGGSPAVIHSKYVANHR